VRSAFSKLVVIVWAVAGLAWAAPGQFSAQKRVGLTAGDQWEPALSADGAGHLYILYPHYAQVPDCKDCTAPTMLLVVSNDNGKTWQTPRVMLQSSSGQYDAQIVVDPADRRTLYAAWLQNRKRVVMLAKSVDSGVTWNFSVAVRSEVELDKPVLGVRGDRIFLGFNHEEDVWVAASQDGGRSFTSTRVNTDARPGWSLLGGTTVDPTGNVFLAWASYSKAGGARGPVNLYVAKSVDAGKTWNRNLLDVSAAAPGCPGPSSRGHPDGLSHGSTLLSLLNPVPRSRGTATPRKRPKQRELTSQIRMVLTGIPAHHATHRYRAARPAGTRGRTSSDQARVLRHLGGYSVTESFACITQR